jgi:hypothetical protein
MLGNCSSNLFVSMLTGWFPQVVPMRSIGLPDIWDYILEFKAFDREEEIFAVLSTTITNRRTTFGNYILEENNDQLSEYVAVISDARDIEENNMKMIKIRHASPIARLAY